VIMSANMTSVRLTILNAIVASLAAMEENKPPNDPYGLTFSTVALGPLSGWDQRKKYSAGIVAGPEKETFQYPFVMCFLTLNVEFRVTVNRDDAAPGASDKKVLRKLHQTLRKITEDFESRWHFNTCIASVMELVNVLYDEEPDISSAVLAETAEKLALMLAPFAPYVSQEIWEELGREGPVFRQPWPPFDPELAKEDEAEIVVQVNGKLRARFHAPFGTPKEELEARARADEKVRAFLEGKQVVRIVSVADKLVNIVVK